MATSSPGMQDPEKSITQDDVEPPSGSPDPGCPVVGIGASAGGLAAFEAFFSGMPPGDPGMAFVLVQHLAPDHKSMLAELVRRFTRMHVFEVTDGLAVKPNCTYIIPPDRNMVLRNGVLHLLESPRAHGHRLPIDFFFSSLAHDQHDRAICIVLSGTGNDGTLGARAVKAEGGIVIAQNPASAEYDGMPRSTINTGLVDYVLPPAEIPAQLISYVAHSFGTRPPISRLGPNDQDSLQEIFRLLRAQTGRDFSQYKPNTINRRVERRMAVHQIKELAEYAAYLDRTPPEVDALFRDLLIGVTSFFRDVEAFTTLRQQVIPRLFAGKPIGSLIRVWVPGCSTGEEAYSIAILLQEQMEAMKQSFKLQIFATDIDRLAIDQARTGAYPPSIAADVSPERLARFLVQEPDGGFRIQKNTRDLVVFSEQDLIKDPPFSKLDFISCRNVLIYMGPELQRKLILLFHYALNPGGMLFLGTSESVGEFDGLFATIDRKSKVYLRQEDAQSRRVRTPFPQMEERSRRPSGKTAADGKLTVRQVAERAMLEEYTPAGALIDEHGVIFYLHGRTGQYLEPAQGEAAMNILKMAREGLGPALTATLYKAVVNKQAVRQAGLQVKTNGDFTTVNLTVQPAPTGPESAGAPPLYLAVFESGAPPDSKQSGESDVLAAGIEAGPGATEADRCIAMLRQELRAKEEYLQLTNQDLQATNEALNSSNEEMQSLNEELQSTNEELETSKEELQSVNEEIATVNAELQTKLSDLTRTNNDMHNLLAGTGIGTIFVDEQLRVRFFTPAVAAAINLIPTDVGRPVGHIVSNLLGYDRLVDDVRSVLRNLEPKEVEVQTNAGQWYLLRIRPYRTLENAIDGAVITLTDVTDMRKSRATRQDSEIVRRLAAVVHDANDGMTVQDLAGRISAWNPAAAKIYGWSEDEALSMNIREMIPESRREEELASVRRRCTGEVQEPYRAQRIAKDGHVVDVMLTSTALVTEAGRVYAIATTEREIK